MEVPEISLDNLESNKQYLLLVKLGDYEKTHETAWFIGRFNTREENGKRIKEVHYMDFILPLDKALKIYDLPFPKSMK